jgi:hypothetical protein
MGVKVQTRKFEQLEHSCSRDNIMSINDWESARLYTRSILVPVKFTYLHSSGETTSRNSFSRKYFGDMTCFTRNLEDISIPVV